MEQTLESWRSDAAKCEALCAHYKIDRMGYVSLCDGAKAMHSFGEGKILSEDEFDHVFGAMASVGCK